MIADEIWILTAFSVVPQNFLILRCCFSHFEEQLYLPSILVKVGDFKSC